MTANGAERGSLTPEQAVDRLEHLHTAASNALREALARYTRSGIVPTAKERDLFRYPELCVDWQPSGAVHFTRRAWAKFQSPGLYSTTVTQPAFFRRYLLEQLRPLAEEFGARIEVRVSTQEIPYPFVTEEGDEFVHGDLSVAELARHFPTTELAQFGDEVERRLLVARRRRVAPAGPVRRAAHRLLAAPASPTTPARLPSTCSPTCCSPTTIATSTSSCAWRCAELRRRAEPTTHWRCPAASSSRRGDEPAAVDAAIAAAAGAPPDAGLPPDGPTAGAASR